jgi:hypothetical protein
LAKILIVADKVAPQEECHGGREGPENCYIHYQRCWIQKVYVIRGDEIAVHETDFGAAENYEDLGISPMIIPSFGENSVSEVQYLLDQNRHDNYWAKRSQELQEGSTLMRDIVSQIEEIEQVRRNVSIFGPVQTTQRNGYAAGLNYKTRKAKLEEQTGRKTFYPS